MSMDPITITPEQYEKRRQELAADLQQTQQQINLWTQKTIMLQGAMLELDGWMKGDLTKRNSPDGEKAGT